jgi:peptide/nickel transport system ATP-binding protein
MQYDENAPVLEIKDLNLSYWTRAGEIPAVIDFSLTVNKGESIGLVGESGCGKSTVAMAIMQYMGTNGSIKSGSIKFKGIELNELSEEELRKLRGKEISMIYQEPFAALNPSLTVASQLKEVPLTHEGVNEANSVWSSPWRCCRVRRCCCSTNRQPRWMSRSRRASSS